MKVETPLTRRFADTLAEAEPHHLRVGIEAYVAAFLKAEPNLATSPERRLRLRGAIDELAEAGLIFVSRAIDQTELPPLPRFIVLCSRLPDPPVGPEVAAYPWRPELAWAARLPLRRSEFDSLQTIQTFLRDRATGSPIVPTGERSLELFGDEKRLDAIRRNQRLFGAGRLSLEMLRTRSFAPPFVYRHLGSGPVALVLENVATYRSTLATVPAESPIGLIIFGAGSNFAGSVCYLTELASEGTAAFIREIRYFGDLDPRGLEIPIAADIAARQAGLPRVQPAVSLWTKLLELGRPAAHAAVTESKAERLSCWLPERLQMQTRHLLTSGMRLAQEAVGTEVLENNQSWSSLVELSEAE